MMIENIKTIIELIKDNIIIIPIGITFIISLYLLYVIAYIRIFTKANRSVFAAIIPIYNVFVLYSICWNVKKLILAIVLVIISTICDCFIKVSDLLYIPYIICLLGYILIDHIIIKFKLAKSYSKGFFFGLGLIVLEPIFILILGLSSSKYKKIN